MRRCTLVCSRDGRRLSASITAFLDEVKVACRSTRLPLVLSTPYLLPAPDFVGSCHRTIASISWPSNSFSSALGMKMTDYINEMDRGRQRARSPALSDISDFTILSRSPSSVPNYDTDVGFSSTSPPSTLCASSRLRREDGCFISRKRPQTPERLVMRDWCIGAC
jgi:hypothetical protein